MSQQPLSLIKLIYPTIRESCEQRRTSWTRTATLANVS